MIKTDKTYYDFKDVLIKPTFSHIESRNSVELRSSFKESDLFLNWNPIPIMSANMDTVTDIDMAFELLKRNWIPVLHKYVSKTEISILFDQIDEYNKTAESKIDYRNLFISRGTTETDKEKLKERIESEPRIKSVCIDVANGHRKSVPEYIKILREGICKDKILMVGNVGSADMVASYADAGVNIIKAGIGPGCFHPNTPVKTINGFVDIQDIKIGDHVLTHTNKYEAVIGLTKYEEKDKLIAINGNLSTVGHKYYVINKKDIVNDKSILKHSFWLEAENIDMDAHLLVSTHLTTKQIKNIEEVSYSGIVYDIEVEISHSFLINGDIFVHNSACETRVKTGVGTPQITLIDDIYKEIERLNLTDKILLTSDGGCKNEGDIAKGFVAGADFIMIGGMLSGYKESPGVIEIVDGRKFKRFSGMAAKESQHNGVPLHGTEEGKTVMIPYKGKVYHKLLDIEGGLRSACSYTNSKTISELRKADLILSTVQENKIYS